MEIDGISAILLSSHAMLAGITRTPEFALNDVEASNLAKGISAVTAYYDTAISAKTLAWINLVQVAGMVYGPRFFMISARRGEERKAKRATAPIRPAQFASGERPRAPTPGITPLEGFMPSELNQVEPN